MNVSEEQWEQFVADNMKEREWKWIPRNNPYSKKRMKACNGISDRSRRLIGWAIKLVSTVLTGGYHSGGFISRSYA